MSNNLIIDWLIWSSPMVTVNWELQSFPIQMRFEGIFKFVIDRKGSIYVVPHSWIDEL